ncbi:unnamed protein product, partial [Mesorhabditis spiculigera]
MEKLVHEPGCTCICGTKKITSTSSSQLPDAGYCCGRGSGPNVRPASTLSLEPDIAVSNKVTCQPSHSLKPLSPLSNEKRQQRIGKLLDDKDKLLNGGVPIRAVDLAGWLVAEYDITRGSPAWEGVPEDVANKGEYITMKYLGHEKGDRQFNEHRSRFITDADFDEIARNNFNTVRIPIGYWLRGADGFSGDELEGMRMWAPGSLDYLDTAIRDWALNNNLFVLISFQAGMGSQNGRASSSPHEFGQADWGQFGHNIANSHAFAEWLADRYKKDPAFLGISLLDEPENVDTQTLKQYYYDCNGRIRHNVGSDCLLTISPLVDQQLSPTAGNWMEMMPEPGWHNIAFEWHVDYARKRGTPTFQHVINDVQMNLMQAIRGREGRDLFIGKWSLAAGFKLTDEETRHFAMAQLEAYKSARVGWCFSTWKCYNDDAQPKNPRSARQLLKNGILPKIESSISTKQKLRKFLDAKDEMLTGAVPIRAVNLAGWLVAEYDITKGSPAWERVPENVAIQGEYITMKYLGHEKGDRQFKEHRDRFITESDFGEIAGYGFNTVRIPIGYWLRGTDGFSGDELDVVKTWAPDSVDYLDRAIRDWAYKNNLFVMIAIQAAMGSQNGKASSSPQKLGHNGWCEKPTNVQNTHAFAEWLARRYREDAAFLGISLLDEPENAETQPLKQYYYDCNGRTWAVRKYYASYFANDRFIWKLVWRWFEVMSLTNKSTRTPLFKKNSARIRREEGTYAKRIIRQRAMILELTGVLKCNCKASVVAATVFDRATEQFCLAQKIIPRCDCLALAQDFGRLFEAVNGGLPKALAADAESEAQRRALCYGASLCYEPHPRQRMQCKHCYLLYKWFNEVGDALSDAVSRLSTTFWAKDMTGPKTLTNNELDEFAVCNLLHAGEVSYLIRYMEIIRYV